MDPIPPAPEPCAHDQARPEPRARSGVRAPPASTLGAFIAMPTATSLIFLLSAACILGGVWMVAEPIFTDPDRLPEWFAILGVLHGYEAALLGVGLLLMRWQRGNPDAIGLGVLIAAFLVGSSVALDTVSIGAPAWTLACGMAGSALACAKGTLFARDPGGARMPALLVAGVLVLLLWNGMWPGLLGLHARDAVALDAWKLWLPGWWMTVGGAGLLLVGAVRRYRPEDDRGQPFVLRMSMRWIMGYVVLACTGIHQYALGYTHGLPMEGGDFLALVAVGCLGLGELRARAFGNHGPADAAIAGCPVLLGVAAMAGGEPGMGLVSPLAALCYPPLVMAAAAAACIWLGWRRAQPALHAVAAAGTLAAVWTWGVDQPGHGFNHHAAAALLAGMAALTVWRWPRPRVVMAVVVTATVMAMMEPMVRQQLEQWRLGAWHAWMALAGVGALVVCVIWPGAFPRPLQRIAAAVLVLGVMACCFARDSGLHAPLLATALSGMALVAAAWRARDAVVALPAGVPGAVVLPGLLPDNKGWLAILAAFALLGAGALVSYLRTRRLAGAPVTPAASPAESPPPA